LVIAGVAGHFFMPLLLKLASAFLFFSASVKGGTLTEEIMDAVSLLPIAAGLAVLFVLGSCWTNNGAMP
jgi:hypothetical protein